MPGIVPGAPLHARSGAMDEVLQATVPYPETAPFLLDTGFWTFWAATGSGTLYSSDISYIRI